MKTKNLGILAVAVVGFFLGASSQAAVPVGYFKGSFKNSKGEYKSTAHVFIRTSDVGGVPVSYGLMVRASDEKAALFRIEELDDSTQAWIRLSITPSGLIGTNIGHEAAFSGQVLRDGISLIPTAFGQGHGCGEEIWMEPKDGMAWKTLDASGKTFAFDFRKDMSVTLTFGNGAGVLSGKLELAGQLLNGTFNLSEIIPGAAMMRPQVLSSESSDGRSLERNVSALVAMIYKDGWFGGGDDAIRFVKISNGDRACLDDSTVTDWE